jgi:hypothetical protein
MYGVLGGSLLWLCNRAQASASPTSHDKNPSKGTRRNNVFEVDYFTIAAPVNIDPFSIIGAVVTGGKTLFAITENILGFVDEVRTANQSIQGIYDEVDSLRQTLDAINHSLASSLLSNPIVGSQVTSALWPPVLKSIQDCKLTIHRLYNILKGMKRQNSGVAARTVTAIKFSRSDREVQVLKGRIQAHNSSLQLVLQTITVYVNIFFSGL